jgi:hypothetical protein
VGYCYVADKDMCVAERGSSRQGKKKGLLGRAERLAPRMGTSKLIAAGEQLVPGHGARGRKGCATIEAGAL